VRCWSCSGSASPLSSSTTTASRPGAEAAAQRRPHPPAAAEAARKRAEGKLIFTQNCGTCHTLKDAGTNGQVGPVLDQVKPDKQLVLKAIKNGGLGSGTMPANIVTGKEADAVATYVSSVAGK
jgi:mono/diheme cytochrome c family protein